MVTNGKSKFNWWLILIPLLLSIIGGIGLYLFTKNKIQNASRYFWIGVLVFLLNVIVINLSSR